MLLNIKMFRLYNNIYLPHIKIISIRPVLMSERST